MRKLKLQVQLTLDGFIAGPDGEMDWMTLPWTADILAYVKEITDPVDGILLGRKLAEGFIPYWNEVAKNPEDPDFDGGVKFSNTEKYVFSKSLTSSPWQHTSVINGDLAEEINRLKSEKGKDLIAYGGGSLVSALINERLIDELHLFINPVAIGRGTSLFSELNQIQNFKLKTAKSFDCGIVLTCYELGR